MNGDPAADERGQGDHLSQGAPGGDAEQVLHPRLLEGPDVRLERHLGWQDAVRGAVPGGWARGGKAVGKAWSDARQRRLGNPLLSRLLSGQQ